MAAGKSAANDDTLRLPRILCLHGGGTNAIIFRAQCRVLERVLKRSFRLSFAEAPFPSDPGPEVLSVYEAFGPFRAWLSGQREDPEKEEESIAGAIEASLQRAMAEDNGKGATGEWVGLLGFSQGAKICASLLYKQQQVHSNSKRMVSASEWSRSSKESSKSLSRHCFRFAVLLAGRGPLLGLTPDVRPMPDSSNLGRGGDEVAVTTTQDALLSLPTIHVHGLADPGLALHRQLLYECCDQRSSRLIEWDGEHRVPIKTKDVAIVVEAILSMAKDTGVLKSMER